MLNPTYWETCRRTLRVFGLVAALCVIPVVFSGCGGSNSAERPESYGPAPSSDDAKMEGGGSGSDTEESSEPLAAPN